MVPLRELGPCHRHHVRPAPGGYQLSVFSILRLFLLSPPVTQGLRSRCTLFPHLSGFPSHFLKNPKRNRCRAPVPFPCQDLERSLLLVRTPPRIISGFLRSLGGTRIPKFRIADPVTECDPWQEWLSEKTASLFRQVVLEKNGSIEMQVFRQNCPDDRGSYPHENAEVLDRRLEWGIGTLT